ncbi:MAG: hypothetical protein J7515_07070, partial [Caulobacter sp.]|nr:hypothetical protein [Caulobacter sp.]
AWTDRESIAVASAEVRAFVPGLKSVSSLPPLKPGIPVAVVVASRHPDDATAADWRAAQVEPARRSDCGAVADALASHTSVLDAQRNVVTAMAAWLAGARAWAGRGRCPGRFSD